LLNSIQFKPCMVECIKLQATCLLAKLL